jgi:hypothetical protein
VGIWGNLLGMLLGGFDEKVFDGHLSLVFSDTF